MIQTTEDGERCTQILKLNESVIWETTLNCPSILHGSQGIYATGDDRRVFQGQMRKFKFFTDDIEK